MAIKRLKQWLRKREAGSITVRTYAGRFEWPDASGCDNVDELVHLAEANPQLRLIALDRMRISDGDSLAHEADADAARSGMFHQQIKAEVSGWARYVAALRNRIGWPRIEGG